MGRKKKVKKLDIGSMHDEVTEAKPIDIKTIEKWYYSNPKDTKKGNEHMSVGYEKIVNDVVMERTGEITAYMIIKE